MSCLIASPKQNKQIQLNSSLKLPLSGRFIIATATGAVTENDYIAWNEAAQKDK